VGWCRDTSSISNNHQIEEEPGKGRIRIHRPNVNPQSLQAQIIFSWRARRRDLEGQELPTFFFVEGLYQHFCLLSPLFLLPQWTKFIAQGAIEKIIIFSKKTP